MIKNRFKINDDETKVVIATSSCANLSHDFQVHIGQENIIPSTACESVGVMQDKHMNIEAQVKYVCRSVSFHLHGIRMIRDLITSAMAEQFVRCLITSRLNYRNSLLSVYTTAPFHHQNSSFVWTKSIRWVLIIQNRLFRYNTDFNFV